MVARDGGQGWNLGENSQNNFRRISLFLYSTALSSGKSDSIFTSFVSVPITVLQVTYRQENKHSLWWMVSDHFQQNLTGNWLLLCSFFSPESLQFPIFCSFLHVEHLTSRAGIYTLALNTLHSPPEGTILALGDIIIHPLLGIFWSFSTFVRPFCWKRIR